MLETENGNESPYKRADLTREILVALLEKKHATCRTLAKYLSRPDNLINRVLRRLEEDRLVVSRPDAKDGRLEHYVLTIPKGVAWAKGLQVISILAVSGEDVLQDFADNFEGVNPFLRRETDRRKGRD